MGLNIMTKKELAEWLRELATQQKSLNERK
jgi:hypothetical protein